MAFPVTEIKYRRRKIARAGRQWTCGSERCKLKTHQTFIEAFACGCGDWCTAGDLARHFPFGGDEGVTFEDIARSEYTALYTVISDAIARKLIGYGGITQDRKMIEREVSNLQTLEKMLDPSVPCRILHLIRAGIIMNERHLLRVKTNKV